MGLRPTGSRLYIDGHEVSSRVLSHEFYETLGSHEYTAAGAGVPSRVYNGVHEATGSLNFLYDSEGVTFEAGDQVESLYLFGPDLGAPTRRMRHGMWQTTHSHPSGGLQEVVAPIGDGETGWRRGELFYVLNAPGQNYPFDPDPTQTYTGSVDAQLSHTWLDRGASQTGNVTVTLRLQGINAPAAIARIEVFLSHRAGVTGIFDEENFTGVNLVDQLTAGEGDAYVTYDLGSLTLKRYVNIWLAVTGTGSWVAPTVESGFASLEIV